MRNLILKTFSILVLTMPIYAIDISDFDIKGMTLNDSFDSIIKKLPCSPDVSSNPLVCNKNNNRYVIIFNHKKDIIEIRREIQFNSKKNFKKIEQQVVSKYGNFNIKAEILPSSQNQIAEGYIVDMCWGKECKEKEADESGIYLNGTEIYIEDGNVFFDVKYRNWRVNDSADHSLVFKLFNNKLEKEEYIWEKEQEKKELEKEKNAIDL